jgi:hypothetical protein
MKRMKNYLRFIKEAQEETQSALGPEIRTTGESQSINVLFGAGKYDLPSNKRAEYVKDLTDVVKLYQNWNEIMKLYSENRGSQKKHIDPLFTIHVGTSWEGTSEINKDVAQKRRTYMENIVMDVVQEACKLQKLDIIPPKDLLQQFITPHESYKRSELLDTYGGNFDKENTPKDWWNRFGVIQVNNLVLKGLTPDKIAAIGAEMRTGENKLPDDTQKIVDELCKCETISDLDELNQNLKDRGGLEKMLNNTLGTSFGYPLMKDRKPDLKRAIDCINNVAPNRAREFQNKIVINPPLK